MFAVIRTGGKQYKVAKDDVVRVERLNAKTGSKVSFDNVLMVGNSAASTFGSPLIKGASVAGTVMEQGREEKILVFKRKRRQGYRRLKGHRQHVTLVKITDINTGNKKPSSKSKTSASSELSKKKQATQTKTTAKKTTASDKSSENQ